MSVTRRSSTLSVRCALALLFGLGGCAEEHLDEARLCFVSAEDEIVVAVSWPCASDHRGAKLSCEIEHIDQRTLRVHSIFVAGRDPDDSCAPPLIAECRSNPILEGVYEVLYGDENFEIAIPDGMLPPCEEE